MKGPAVRIGALLDRGTLDSPLAPRLDDLGLESYSYSFWKSLGGADLPALADTLRARFGFGTTALSIYGNPLSEDEEGRETLEGLGALIEAAPRFGAGLVTTFAGRVPGKSVPDSIAAWKETFDPLCDRASALGVSIGFENCRLGDTWKTGRWNIAINPDAWELMFESLPEAPIGLEWEPSHQVLALVDPLVQLRMWAPRILHIHGKDARIERPALALRGIHGAGKIGVECLPGQGDTDWARAFSILSEAGYQGAIDVEIGAIPGYEGKGAITGIEIALAALAEARRKG